MKAAKSGIKITANRHRQPHIGCKKILNFIISQSAVGQVPANADGQLAGGILIGMMGASYHRYQRAIDEVTIIGRVIWFGRRL